MQSEGGAGLGLRGEIALVTGASGGIGQAVAMTLARHGATVAALARSHEGLEQTVARSGARGCTRIRAWSCDLADRDAVTDVVQDVERELGPPTILINNAGQRQEFASIEALSDLVWDSAMDANVTWAFRVSRLLIPGMKRAGHGVILNIGSVAGSRPIPRTAAYSAAKAALHSLTQCIAQEYAVDGIRANALAPGWIETPMNEELRSQERHRATLESIKSKITLGRFGTVDEVAGLATVLVSPAASYVTGQVIYVDGGLML